jgi:hypothetical protein
MFFTSQVPEQMLDLAHERGEELRMAASQRRLVRHLRRAQRTAGRHGHNVAQSGGPV